MLKNGEIKILEDQNKYFSKITHPAKINGKWEKRTNKGTPLFRGNFYNVGYFPEKQDPSIMELNWEALDYEMSFVNHIVRTLRQNKCSALQSEGDGIYFPFIWTGALEINELPDDNELGVLASKEISLAYKNNEIISNYSNLPIFYDLTEQNNIFWDDDLEGKTSDEMELDSKKAFIEVSKIIKSELPIVSLIQYYPDYVEFPVVIGGKNKFGHFMGLITSLVWT